MMQTFTANASPMVGNRVCGVAGCMLAGATPHVHGRSELADGELPGNRSIVVVVDPESIR